MARSGFLGYWYREGQGPLRLYIALKKRRTEDEEESGACKNVQKSKGGNLNLPIKMKMKEKLQKLYLVMTQPKKR